MCHNIPLKEYMLIYEQMNDNIQTIAKNRELLRRNKVYGIVFLLKFVVVAVLQVWSSLQHNFEMQEPVCFVYFEHEKALLKILVTSE